MAKSTIFMALYTTHVIEELGTVNIHILLQDNGLVSIEDCDGGKGMDEESCKLNYLQARTDS